MYQCYTDIPSIELDRMQAITDYFVPLVREQGTIYYDQFVEQGLQPGSTSINRNNLTHVRHWAEIINNNNMTIARLQAEKKKKDRNEIAQSKDGIRATKILLDYQKELDKVEKKQHKEELKINQKRLFDALPPEEKKKIRLDKAQSLQNRTEAKVVTENIKKLEKERERQWARDTHAKHST
jgi:hypothetical protein